MHRRVPSAHAVDLRTYQMVTNSIADIVSVVGEDEVYRLVNDAWCRSTGLKREDVIGRSVAEVLPGSITRERRQALNECLRDQRPGMLRDVFTQPDGTLRYLETTYAPFAEPVHGVRCAALVTRDVTAEEMAAQATQASQQALLAAKDEAERANRAKSRFMSLMSHELRTPMNAILGFGQLLLSDPRHPLTPEQRRHAEEILVGGRHLLRLINDVLDLGRIETGRLAMALQPVALQPLAEECLALMAPLAQARPVRLLLPEPGSLQCHVHADPLRLKQVLLNLLSNAIKYNRRDGDVTLRCVPQPGQVELRISDTGIGITPDQGQRLFVAFERLGAGQSNVEGSGIGLALSRQLMRAMGGEIGAESELDVGSTFWVRLRTVPALPAAAPAAPPATPSALDATRQYTVLYVEDNEVNAVLMRAMLARLPVVQLEHTVSPLQALEMARALRPQLLLLDIQLPEIDGFELLRRLRADPATRHTPAIAVSAAAMPADIERALQAGFDDYLTKPLDLGELLQAVQQHLHRARRD
jgi:PAS domain S-box-containing protein